MHGPKSKGRRFVEFDLRRITQSSSRRHTVGSRARQSVSLKKGDATNTEGNEKADESAKEGAMLDEGAMAQIRVSTVQK